MRSWQNLFQMWIFKQSQIRKTSLAKPFIIFLRNIFSICCDLFKLGKLSKASKKFFLKKNSIYIWNFSFSGEIFLYEEVWSKIGIFASGTSHVGSTKNGQEYRFDEFVFLTRCLAALMTPLEKKLIISPMFMMKTFSSGFTCIHSPFESSFWFLRTFCLTVKARDYFTPSFRCLKV